MLTVAMSLTKVQGRFILQLDKKVTAINAVPIVGSDLQVPIVEVR